MNRALGAHVVPCLGTHGSVACVRPLGAEATHPEWLALPFGSRHRDSTMRALGLGGVVVLPELIVMAASTGERQCVDGVGALQRGLLTGAREGPRAMPRMPPTIARSGIVSALALWVPASGVRATSCVRVQRHVLTQRAAPGWRHARRRCDSSIRGLRRPVVFSCVACVCYVCARVCVCARAMATSHPNVLHRIAARART